MRAESEAGRQQSSPTDEIIGRGVREGARLFREWFNSLTRIAESGGSAAYVFVMGSMVEVLHTFDLPISFPEVNALNTAIRRVSRKYLTAAEDYGYSPDICGYVKADVALQLGGGEYPMGRVPKPSIAILSNTCNTYIKWGEIWERMYDTPTVTFDFPGNRTPFYKTQPGTKDFEFEKKYVAGQIQELIAACERITGRKFDIDKFREIGRASCRERV